MEPEQLQPRATKRCISSRQAPAWTVMAALREQRKRAIQERILCIYVAHQQSRAGGQPQRLARLVPMGIPQRAGRIRHLHLQCNGRKCVTS